MRTVFVANVAYHVSEGALRRLFETIGEVRRVTIVVNHESGQSRGFAFVEFANEDCAQRAIDSLNGTLLEGRNLTVQPAHQSTGGGRRDDRP